MTSKKNNKTGFISFELPKQEEKKDTTCNLDNIAIQLVKKTKKQEPKIFPSLMLIDKEAFEGCGQTNGKQIMKEFWNSQNNRILIARKQDTQAIIGYAIFSVYEMKDERFGNKRIPSVYLMRIAVRI